MNSKNKYHSLCYSFVEERISSAQKAIASAQAAANDETKSSAGDKYETGRAMMQLEIEKNTVQLGEALKLKQVLDQIDPEKKHEVVSLGSLVTTNEGKFYISISAGQLTTSGEKFFAISAVSPIGKMLMGKRRNDSFEFNGRKYVVEEVL
ncbi:MAG: 3-oxoacyl-ACP synthase [Cytophagaceae bacterium]